MSVFDSSTSRVAIVLGYVHIPYVVWAGKLHAELEV